MHNSMPNPVRHRRAFKRFEQVYGLLSRLQRLQLELHLMFLLIMKSPVFSLPNFSTSRQVSSPSSACHHPLPYIKGRDYSPFNYKTCFLSSPYIIFLHAPPLIKILGKSREGFPVRSSQNISRS